ncbi:DNA-binding transcriptional LysR family regulator [Rhizobium tibeticum]|nr:DNA-binding transcriptional LysR family regulator [Rhizobium tibeticum]
MVTRYRLAKPGPKDLMYFPGTTAYRGAWQETIAAADSRITRVLREASEADHSARSRVPALINLRMLSGGGLYAWELEKEARELRVRVEGQLAFNNVNMIVRAAEDGYGLGFVMEDHASQQLADGRLVRVLEDWCPSFPGYHLYYPSRRQPSAAFSVLVDALRYRG